MRRTVVKLRYFQLNLITAGAVMLGTACSGDSDTEPLGGLTISGIALPNATVTAMAGSNTAQATADANGVYAVDLGDQQRDAVVTVTARGTGAQSTIELATSLDTVGQLLALTGSDDILDVTEYPGTRLDAFTTVRYARIYELSGNRNPATRAELIDAELRYNQGTSTSIGPLAAAIDRVIEAPTTPLPAGIGTTLDLALSPAEAVAYTQPDGITRLDGISEALDALGAKVSAVYDAFSPDTSEQYLANFAPKRRDVIGYLSAVYQFAAGQRGNAYETRGRGLLRQGSPFDWASQDGTLRVDYTPADSDVFVNLDGAAAAAILGDPSLADQIDATNVVQVRTQRRRTNFDTIPGGIALDWILAEDVIVYRFAEAYPTLNLPDIETSSYYATTFRKASTFEFQRFTDEQVRSQTWVMQVPQQSVRGDLFGDFVVGDTIVPAVLLTFNNDQTASIRYEGTVSSTATWNLTAEGRIDMTYGNGITIEIALVEQFGRETGVLTTARIQGEPYIQYQRISRVDPSVSLTPSMLESNTQYWQNTINRSSISTTASGPTGFEQFGFQFTAGGDTNRYIFGDGDEFVVEPVDYTYRLNNANTIEIDRFMNQDRVFCNPGDGDESCQLERRRTWQPIKFDNGWLFVLETDVWRPRQAVYDEVTQQYTVDGEQINLDDYTYLIPPRLNAYYLNDTP